MSVRVVHIGVSLPRRRGQPTTIRAEVAAVVSFNQATFAEIRSAAKQTNLPICSYLQEVVEADLATRRMTSLPLPTVKANGDADSPSARTTR